LRAVLGAGAVERLRVTRFTVPLFFAMPLMHRVAQAVATFRAKRLRHLAAGVSFL
jgi:hypothetical protein